MKKGIIPVCLACIMLVSTCKRETGGDRGKLDQDTGFENGKSSYSQSQSVSSEGSSESGAVIKRGAHRPVMREQTRSKNKVSATVATGSKRKGEIQRDGPPVVSNTDKSKRKFQDRTAVTTKRVSDRAEISAPAAENKKGDSVLSDTNKEPMPGGLLVKPRVDVPEVK